MTCHLLITAVRPQERKLRPNTPRRLHGPARHLPCPRQARERGRPCPGRAGPPRAACTWFQTSFPSLTAPRPGSAAPRGGRGRPGEGENRGPHRGRLHHRRSRPCLPSPAAAAAALPHPLPARPLATLPRQPIRGRLGAVPANRSPAAGAGGGTWRALRG